MFTFCLKKYQVSKMQRITLHQGDPVGHGGRRCRLLVNTRLCPSSSKGADSVIKQYRTASHVPLLSADNFDGQNNVKMTAD